MVELMIVLPAISTSRFQLASADRRYAAVTTSSFSRSVHHMVETFTIRTDYSTVRSHIARLLNQRNPTAIARKISEIIINTVYRQIISVTIGESPVTESYEQRPFVTDRNASAAVAVKTLIVRITATGKHTSPNAMKSRSMAARTSIMNNMQMSVDVDPQTATGSDESVSQMFSRRDMLATTIAAASPHGSPGLMADMLEHRQSPENLTSDIDDSGHANLHHRLAGQVAESICEIDSAAHSTADLR